MKVKMLVPLLLSVLLATLMIPAASASKSSVIWGTTYDSSNAEINSASDACAYIANHFNWYTNYDWCANAFGSGTTTSNVESTTSYCNTNYDKNVVFYVGHGWNETYINGAYHYHIYPDNHYLWAYGIQDRSIHDRTTAGTHYFVFIWACFQGNEIGYDQYVPSLNKYEGVGMPHAWTQRTNLNTNGYSYNDGTAYCWIGFKGPSPPLNEPAGTQGYEYGNFVKYFYYFLTYHGETIHDALDDASTWVFGVKFNQSPLGRSAGYTLDFSTNYYSVIFTIVVVCFSYFSTSILVI